MKIKVCGIASIEEALALSKAGVNYMGFIFYPASKRYALHALTLDQIKSVQLPGVLKVGVFVNEPMDDVIATAPAAAASDFDDEPAVASAPVEAKPATQKAEDILAMIRARQKQ